MGLDSNKTSNANMAPAVFLIVGPAGSGLTSALNVFSDFGFLQVADVAPRQWIDVMTALKDKAPHIAFTLSSTRENRHEIEELIKELPAIKDQFPELNVLYLDAPEEILIQRYVDSEKRHSFEESKEQTTGLEQAIQEQRQSLGGFKSLKSQFPNGYYSIDTSIHSPSELRAKMAKILGLTIEQTPMTIYIQSFGFKHGLPKGSELVFDMRFIKNPYYKDALRPLTGLDKPVQDFILAEPCVKDFLSPWTHLIGSLLPSYHQEGKLRLTISIGCTGGQHRSVCLSEALGNYLKQHHPEYNIVVAHREKEHWPCSKTSPQPQLSPSTLHPAKSL